ncbi:hypothetical protein PG990_005287 [Apiospora arundinis]
MMNNPNQPLLAEEAGFRTAETGSTQTSQRSESNCEEAISLVSIGPSVESMPGSSPSSSHDESSDSVDDGGRPPTCFHLLPRQLDQQHSLDWVQRVVPPNIEITFISIIMFSAGWGGYKLISSTVERNGYAYSGTDCASASAAGVEKGFLVNLQVASDLSFTQAKLLDLAWDTVIGQGLRFFHGWVLYHAISRRLTAAMESDTMPHKVYLDMQFSTVSFASICSSLSLLFTSKSIKVAGFALWSLFGTAYVLSYATIWSASTGYISGSFQTLAISGMAYVSLREPELKQGWVFDDKRITPNGTKLVITGPQAGDPFQGISSLRSWRDPMFNASGMGEFLDIYSYFLTKSMVSALLQSGNVSIGEDLDVKNINKRPDGWIRSSNIYVGDSEVSFKGDWKPVDKNAPIIGLWQMEPAFRVPIEDRVLIGTQNGKNSSLDLTTNIAARKARFFYTNVNATTHSRAKILPYNSTIWLGGKELHLQAPFLDTSSTCFSSSDGLGACLCLNGVPVDHRVDASLPPGCISDTGYSWGFSSGVLGVALILEGLWITMTWIMWRWACWRSKMVSMRRTGAGTIRNILDAAEAITEHLGNQHSAYTEKELSKQLRNSPPFGYVLESRDGVEHIGLRPIPASSGEDGIVPRKRAKVQKGALYG